MVAEAAVRVEIGASVALAVPPPAIRVVPEAAVQAQARAVR